MIHLYFIHLDTGHSFDALLLYGHEFSLTIFDVLMFSFVDLLVQDYLVAAIVTYFVGKVCFKRLKRTEICIMFLEFK